MVPGNRSTWWSAFYSITDISATSVRRFAQEQDIAFCSRRCSYRTQRSGDDVAGMTLAGRAGSTRNSNKHPVLSAATAVRGRGVILDYCCDVIPGTPGIILLLYSKIPYDMYWCVCVCSSH